MTKDLIVRAWKDSSFRATLSGAELAALPANPAGARLLEIDEEQLQNVSGASDIVGCGWVCSVTSECPMNLASKLAGCGSPVF